MVDVLKVEVQGLKELEQKLLQMAPKLARNGLRASVAAGARVVVAEARKNVPVDTGTLRRAIYQKQIREQSSMTQQTFFVGVRAGKREQKKNRDGYYFPFIEFGTTKMAARPFMRPAFESTKGQALEAMKEKLAQRVEQLAVEK